LATLSFLNLVKIDRKCGSKFVALLWRCMTPQRKPQYMCEIEGFGMVLLKLEWFRLLRGGRRTRRKQFLQLSSTERADKMTAMTATARALNPEALGVELFRSASTISRRISRNPSRFT